MYQLNLFKRKVHRLSDVMPFGKFTSVWVDDDRVAVCINKDGSLPATWKYRGPDLDSSVEEELEVITNRLHQAIAGLKTGYVLYFEAQRTPSTAYTSTDYFPDPVTRGMDAERCKLFSSGVYYESTFYGRFIFCRPKTGRNRSKNSSSKDVKSRSQKRKTYF